MIECSQIAVSEFRKNSPIHSRLIVLLPALASQSEQLPRGCQVAPLGLSEDEHWYT